MSANKPVVAVVGGAGYIGSHTVKTLFDNGFTPVVIDNFSTGHPDFIQWGNHYTCCLSDATSLASLLNDLNPIAVCHFAASINVSESIANPQQYYTNNVIGTLNLLTAMQAASIKYLIFSSTAAVYGNPTTELITEDHSCAPINPYGSSKYMMEQIIKDYHQAYGLNYIIFRYFNAAGADPDSLIGEDHSPETHLIPNLFMAAKGLTPSFNLYGNDYNTPDGTCIRDYIHVSDLATAHLNGLQYLLETNKSQCMNLGTSAGISILDLITEAKAITGISIPYTLAKRRQGDSAQLVSDATLAQKILNWTPGYSSISTILDTAWRWFNKRF